MAYVSTTPYACLPMTNASIAASTASPIPKGTNVYNSSYMKGSPTNMTNNLTKMIEPVEVTEERKINDENAARSKKFEMILSSHDHVGAYIEMFCKQT